MTDQLTCPCCMRTTHRDDIKLKVNNHIALIEEMQSRMEELTKLRDELYRRSEQLALGSLPGWGSMRAMATSISNILKDGHSTQTV